ncbi:His-Xaa-Ser system protein HxsD [Methylosinus sp. Ce-a6]|uniref:His-Xaa-Ser system protein HxsD n=1 Tax=Methylosinus sp. Ce-a6 TaxID=2172005 RepID=UPI00135A809E|nr:His-Xaa-Ser system protein HxsD [Methylosinus sp. Ce-a6]
MIRLELDRSIYSDEAVQKAAYRFIDRFAAIVSRADNSIVVEITFGTESSNQREHVVADFKKELLDQNLRLRIKTETEAVRNLILAYAFSKSGLQE